MEKISWCFVKIFWERVNPPVNLYSGLPVFLKKNCLVCGKLQEGLFPVYNIPSHFTLFYFYTDRMNGNGRQIWRQPCLNMTFRKMYLDTTRMNPNWLLSFFISFEKESKWETYLADCIFNIILKKDLSQLCPLSQTYFSS